jgi:adenylylsulfate reductase subunit A
MDVRHLKRKDLEHLFFTLGVDKDTLPEFLRAKNYNQDGTMIEMTVSEPMQARPSELCGSGIKIDMDTMSSVPGLFGAGDASDQMGCLHMCVAGGFYSGKRAAAYAAGQAHLHPVDKVEITDEVERVFAPLQRKSGVAWGELENVVRIITTDHFGPVKTEVSLTSAIDKLQKLVPYADELKANDLHELMRCHEAMNILGMAKITAAAALARTESRFAPYHYRADFPETDEQQCGLVVVSRDDSGGVKSRFQPLKYSS